MGQESARTLGSMQIRWSCLESWTFAVPNKPASGSSSKGEQWIPAKVQGSSWLKGPEIRHLVWLSVSEQPGSLFWPLNSLTHTHTHTPHTHLQRMEVPERGWETKVAFTQNQLRGDDRGRVCSPEAGCRPVTLSSKMCEISFCWVFYIKRNLFSEKHSISQTLMAFLCADALMRLRLVLIRRKPCR